MTTNSAGASPVERHVRPLLDRLRAGCTDWDGTEMIDETQPMDCLTVGDVRDAVTEIQRLRAELQHARDGLTKGRSRMREDLERHKPLVQAVEWVVEEGHMYVEDLARLRAALDGLRPNMTRYLSRRHDGDGHITVTVNARAAEVERMQCLINGLRFDALGEPRVRYVRVSLAGNHCIMHPSEGDSYVQDARACGDESEYTVADVYLSEREFDDLPEHDGF